MSKELMWGLDENGIARPIGVTTTSSGEAAGLFVIADGAIVAATWAGSGTSGAPDPELYGDNQIGQDLAGISTGLTYHIQGAVGSKVWTPTGATVKNLYGGA